VNRKRVRRLYRLEGLQVRMRVRRRKHMALHRGPAPVPAGPAERWSMDFVHDALADGRPFRVLTVVDQWSRQSPILEVASSRQHHRTGPAPSRPRGCGETPETNRGEILARIVRAERRAGCPVRAPARPVTRLFSGGSTCFTTGNGDKPRGLVASPVPTLQRAAPSATGRVQSPIPSRRFRGNTCNLPDGSCCPRNACFLRMRALVCAGVIAAIAPVHTKSRAGQSQPHLSYASLVIGREREENERGRTWTPRSAANVSLYLVHAYSTPCT
jgi:hypothetical protein